MGKGARIMSIEAIRTFMGMVSCKYRQRTKLRTRLQWRDSSKGYLWRWVHVVHAHTLGEGQPLQGVLKSNQEVRWQPWKMGGGSEKGISREARRGAQIFDLAFQSLAEYLESGLLLSIHKLNLTCHNCVHQHFSQLYQVFSAFSHSLAFTEPTSMEFHHKSKDRY